jgi:hypothetical protein
VAHRAAQALKLAAAALRTSQSALGAYYRRLCSRMDKPKAVTAAAHELARLIYAMHTRGEAYTDRGQTYYEERYRRRVVANSTGVLTNSAYRSCQSRRPERPADRSPSKRGSANQRHFISRVSSTIRQTMKLGA